MATKPVGHKKQGPVSSRDERVNESWAQGEADASIGHSSRMRDKQAPRAEPEEDIDVLEPGALDEMLHGIQTLSRTKIPDVTKLEKNQTSSEKPADRFKDAFPPSSPPLSALSTEECLEKEGLSSLEGEVADCISDAEISDPAEDPLSPDKEWEQTTQLTELVDQEVDSTSEDNGSADEMDTQLHFLADALDNSESGNYTFSAAQHSPFDINTSDHSICSPPFADETEEDEEMLMDITSYQQRCGTLETRSKPLQSTNVSFSTASALPVISPAKQQGELLPQSQCGLTPKGTNQEAAQQVQGQSSPPLSTVTMEPSNQVRPASQGFGCVVAARESHSRVGERTEGESKQTGRSEQQKEKGAERSKAVGQHHGRGLLRYSKTVQVQEQKTEIYSRVSSKQRKHTRMESDSCDDSQSDSGVSADFSPSSTLEGNTTVSATAPKETPIEREIRRAIEREHSLRRSRGLPNLPTSPEYVEIPLRKTVLCQSLTTEKSQGKDRQFAGKKMQHDIHAEVQREQDLVKLGKVPGFYDKGSVRQLKERKQLFEAFQKPSDLTLIGSPRGKTASSSSASDISTLQNQEDLLSPTSTTGGSYVKRSQNIDLLSPTETPHSAKGGGSTSSTPRGPGFPEGTSCQVNIRENNLSVPAQKLYHAKQEVPPVTTVDSGSPSISSFRTGGYRGINGTKQIKEEEEEEEEEEVTPRENPFFKLRTSTNLVRVEQDIREARERERELRKQRLSLYGGSGGPNEGGGGGKRSASTEGKSPRLSSSSVNELAVPDLPVSSPKWGTGPSTAPQSVGKFAVWPPPQAEEGRSESLTSPRTPRHKNPLVQRWESGLFNGHNGDDN
ncbi:hypothetical protein INR49_029436 [Caranx melampygus]|nr:hypothetical protein INR49_029436 [Caranx melampygus]